MWASMHIGQPRSKQMKNKAFIAVLVTGFLHGGGATAANLTNYDEKAQTVTLTEGEKQTSITLIPEKTVEGICIKGCILTLSNGDEYEFHGNEIIAIEEGEIYVDGDLNDLAGDTFQTNQGSGRQ